MGVEPAGTVPVFVAGNLAYSPFSAMYRTRTL